MALMHEMASLLLDRHGRVVIPAAIREAMGVKAGDRLVGYVEAGKLIIRSRDDLIREMQELFRLKPGEESFSKLIRRERDEEVARERDRD